MAESHIAIDFETFYSKKLKCTVQGSTPMQYVRHPRFDAYLLSACDGANSWAGHPRDFNWATLDQRVVVAHNAKFEEVVWNYLASLGVCPKPNYKEMHCTADLSTYLTMQRDLKGASKELLGEEVAKQTREDADGKGWDDFSPKFREEMLAYAKKDALLCWRIYNEFGHKWPDLEKRLSAQNRRQNIKGVRIDVERLDRQLIALSLALAELVKFIPWMSDVEDDDNDEGAGDVWDGSKKPTSTKALAWQCERCGIPNPPAKTKFPDEYEEWFETYGRQHSWVANVSAWRSVNACLKQHKVVKERLVEGDILPFSLKYFGAHTGRWSGDGGFNVQNPRKDVILVSTDYLPFVTGPEYDSARRQFKATGEWPSWVQCVVDVRALIIPREGKKMIISDLSQIEPRVLNWLCGNHEFLDLVKKGISPYEAYARIHMGFSGGNLKAEDPEKYAYAKATVLALGYGCGWKKFIGMARDLADLDVTIGDPETETYEDPRTGGMCVRPGYGSHSRKIVAEFRASNPSIVGMWNSLDSMLLQSSGNELVIRLPNGRAMTYREVKESRRPAISEDTKRGYLKRVLTARIGTRRVETYGGKLTENTTQAVARDVFAEYADVLNEVLLFSAHDEAVLEVDNDVEPRDIEHIMSQTPEWLPGCPVGAEAKVVPHYCK